MTRLVAEVTLLEEWDCGTELSLSQRDEHIVARVPDEALMRRGGSALTERVRRLGAKLFEGTFKRFRRLGGCIFVISWRNDGLRTTRPRFYRGFTTGADFDRNLRNK